MTRYGDPSFDILLEITAWMHYDALHADLRQHSEVSAEAIAHSLASATEGIKGIHVLGRSCNCFWIETCTNFEVCKLIARWKPA